MASLLGLQYRIWAKYLQMLAIFLLKQSQSQWRGQLPLVSSAFTLRGVEKTGTETEMLSVCAFLSILVAIAI